MTRRALALTALVAATACGAPAPAERVAPPPRTAPPTVSPPADLSGPAAELRSARFDLRLPLPDAAGFSVDDAGSPWLTATHAAAATTLLVRVWRADDNRASRASCEAQARLWRDLPGGEGAPVLERRRIDVPAGFDTEVAIGVEAPAKAAPGAPVGGFAVAFGGWARRCFAFVVTTRAEGPEAARLVAARLAAMVEVSLSGLRLESELVPEMRRRPGP